MPPNCAELSPCPNMPAISRPSSGALLETMGTLILAVAPQQWGERGGSHNVVVSDEAVYVVHKGDGGSRVDNVLGVPNECAPILR